MTNIQHLSFPHNATEMPLCLGLFTIAIATGYIDFMLRDKSSVLKLGYPLVVGYYNMDLGGDTAHLTYEITAKFSQPCTL